MMMDGRRGDRTYDPVRIKALKKARAARAKRDAAHKKELRRTQEEQEEEEEEQDGPFLSRRRLDDEGEAAAGALELLHVHDGTSRLT